MTLSVSLARVNFTTKYYEKPLYVHCVHLPKLLQAGVYSTGYATWDKHVLCPPLSPPLSNIYKCIYYILMNRLIAACISNFGSRCRKQTKIAEF